MTFDEWFNSGEVSRLVQGKPYLERAFEAGRKEAVKELLDKGFIDCLVADHVQRMFDV